METNKECVNVDDLSFLFLFCFCDDDFSIPFILSYSSPALVLRKPFFSKLLAQL